MRQSVETGAARVSMLTLSELLVVRVEKHEDSIRYFDYSSNLV